jgi:predicted FMN-binding regulatory protein PaiB
MKRQDIYEQRDYDEVLRLIASVQACLLVTLSEGGEPQFGVFSPGPDGSNLFLHLNRTDEQLVSMRARGRATLIFQDISTVSPSYWADPHYAGAATTFYRFAELSAVVELIDEPKRKIPFMERMMGRYQAEGGYDPIDYESPIYRKKLDTIVVARFTVESFRAKWRLGQHFTPERRLELAERFRKRGDERCADEIVRWLERHGG